MTDTANTGHFYAYKMCHSQTIGAGRALRRQPRRQDPVGAGDLVIGEGQHGALADIRSVPVEERRDQGEHPVRVLRHADVAGPGEHGQLSVRQESEKLDDVGQR